MKIAQFAGSALLIGVAAVGTSGCFATRVVRTDTITSYDLVRAQPVAEVPPQPEGTLVVEALVVPPPPATPALPVRLPSTVADASAVPAWDPLPSYVGQFTAPGAISHRPVFGGSAQSSTSFRRWAPFPGRSAITAPYGYGYGSTTGAYGSASPHFSSPPSYSGSASSHFAGGAPFSGY